MYGLTDISVDFLTGTPLLGWLAMLVMVALAVLLYIRTNPPLPRYLRIIMGSLRVIAVVALVLALLEPVMSYNRQFERDRRVSVLVDVSSSMDRTEQGNTRRARVDSLLASEAFSRLAGTADVRTLYFGDSIAPSPDRVRPDRTALGDAIYELATSQLARPSDYWLLLSDGKSNSGRDPLAAARTASAPMLNIGMALDVGNFDIGLVDVTFNPVVFVGQPTQIKVKLGWHNAAGKKTTVTLLDGNRQIAESQFEITQDAGFGEVNLRYVPAEPGQKLLRVRMPELEQEETGSNNLRTIALKVLKSRISVLLVSEHPDYEVGFLRRFLSRSDKYEVDLRVLGGNAGNLTGSFPDRQTDLNRFDLVVLYDPDPGKLAARENIIRSYLSDRGGALWVLLGENFAKSPPIEPFNRLLPFWGSRTREVQYREFHGEPAESELFHPAVRLADDRTAIRQIWATLPPFQSLVGCDVLDPEAVVLAYAGIGQISGDKPPLLAYKRFGPGKLIASTGLPFWPWSFLNLGFGDDNAAYGSFIEGVISWLTVREDFEPIRVSPVKDVFTRGEPVRFDAVAYDQGFRPIPGVSGTVELVGEKETDRYNADLVREDDGRYSAEFTNIPPGKYGYVGRVESGEQVLKTNRGEIQIETFSLEEFDQSGDPAGLMALASVSGGSYYPFARFDEAIQSMDISPVEETITGEFSIWNKFWLLIVFVVALAIEWIIRKANNLL